MTNANDQNGGRWGAVKARFQMVDDALLLSKRYGLAYDAGVAWSWPWLRESYIGEPGDHQKGAFWYDSTENELKYFMQWTESTGPNEIELRGNIVTRSP